MPPDACAAPKATNRPPGPKTRPRRDSISPPYPPGDAGLAQRASRVPWGRSSGVRSPRSGERMATTPPGDAREPPWVALRRCAEVGLPGVRIALKSAELRRNRVGRRLRCTNASVQVGKLFLSRGHGLNDRVRLGGAAPGDGGDEGAGPSSSGGRIRRGSRYSPSRSSTRPTRNVETPRKRVIPFQLRGSLDLSRQHLEGPGGTECRLANGRRGRLSRH
jgi:hypothetical protein